MVSFAETISKIRKGKHQGDPISAYLFILAYKIIKFR